MPGMFEHGEVRARDLARQTLADLPPLSLGKVLRPVSAEDDLLEEMTCA